MQKEDDKRKSQKRLPGRRPQQRSPSITGTKAVSELPVERQKRGLSINRC